MVFFNNNSFLLSEKVLDFLWKKQTITAKNISNAETPGYKSQYVTFEDELRLRLGSLKSKTASDYRKDIYATKAVIHSTANELDKFDANNVDVDVESAELAKSGLEYEFILKSYNDDLARFRSVIKG